MEENHASNVIQMAEINKSATPNTTSQVGLSNFNINEDFEYFK